MTATVAAGLMRSRTKLKRPVIARSVGSIVVDHRKRLARFGVEQVEAALAAQGCNLVLVEDREVDDDFVRGHHRGSDLYVRASAAAARGGGKAQRALEAVGEAA